MRLAIGVLAVCLAVLAPAAIAEQPATGPTTRPQGNVKALIAEFEAIAALWIPLFEAIEDQQYAQAQTLIGDILKREDKVRAAAEGTEVAPMVEVAIGQLKRLQEAVKAGDQKAIEGTLNALNSLGQRLGKGLSKAAEGAATQ